MNLSRRNVLRGTGVAVLGVAVGGWATACSSVVPGATVSGGAGNLLEIAKSQGFLRVGIANEPPYTQVNTDGTVSGCEPDVLRAVCQRMGIKDIQGIITPYESMIPGLNANRWDVIAAGLFMKQSRCGQVLYSEPVIVSTESFATPKGNPKGITKVANIVADKSLRIAVLPGGFEEGVLKSANVPASQQVKVNDGRSGIEAVKANRADAFMLPTLSLRALAKNDTSFDVTAAVTDAPKTGSGAAFRKTDASFHDAYNIALAAFKKTSGFSDILTKWGFDPSAVVGVTTEELCKTAG
ncbi:MULTISPECIES: ectoine/hydroxyectoine ABC transporter substrate-binding protein EhuB [unclassified Arthrobacter]|uniref:ectoine/hydroxyectoine ABC transporter substrate-binding protein EhuB n=1 Tax=unclassified Arthrobacter TaxID=235627 RepID=UPI00159D3592|nr:MULTISPECIES: ectoine/hydroxyectoine ABC transporter substrate-binding protein EhuB [unclassified Arthrobacter]MCQ9165560.1 ectoine/hydroxyectoine ABC transporter substrate-binding protein EhuB [Arthrobacter sp. STN4]NVN00619.1 ectoine/hydroxyectoine ABC transporter substrate-binding protein EhuB [Arthrobacter sp. SDTb3-6]